MRGLGGFRRCGLSRVFVSREDRAYVNAPSVCEFERAPSVLCSTRLPGAARSPAFPPARPTSSPRNKRGTPLTARLPTTGPRPPTLNLSCLSQPDSFNLHQSPPTAPSLFPIPNSPTLPLEKSDRGVSRALGQRRYTVGKLPRERKHASSVSLPYCPSAKPAPGT